MCLQSLAECSFFKKIPAAWLFPSKVQEAYLLQLDGLFRTALIITPSLPRHRRHHQRSATARVGKPDTRGRNFQCLTVETLKYHAFSFSTTLHALNYTD